MVSISHAFTGAFIASYFPQKPYLYLPLALASHFMLDNVTHYDIGVAAKIYHFKKWQIIALELLDLALAAGLIIWIYQQSLTDFQLSLWLGALAGITPDLLQATDYILQKPLKNPPAILCFPSSLSPLY